MRSFAGALADARPPTRSSPDLAFLRGQVPGVTAAQGDALADLGIRTIVDLLETPPFRYDDFREITSFAGATVGTQATILGTLVDIGERRTSRRNLRIVEGVLRDADGNVATAIWFNQRHLVRVLEPGTLLLVRGDPRRGRRLEITVRQHEVVATPAELESGEVTPPAGLAPVYHASARISSLALRRLVRDALPALVRVPDPVPPTTRCERRLPLKRDALHAQHEPADTDEPEVARRRLAYEELLLLQVALLSHRREDDEGLRATPLPPRGDLRAAYENGLPFALTSAQQQAIAEIDADLGRTVPMQRLLQGDVGSGKTAVALAACLRAIEAGGQAAIMAPTEVLAVQHFLTAERLLGPLAVEICLLTGDVPAREAAARRQRIEAGEPLIAIGTHALLNVSFPRLEVAVVDEQHRFGVEQRGSLRAGAVVPHLLHMTATPIPRSLALTLFGDLDVTTIDELPADRIPVRTAVVPESKRDDGYTWIVDQVRAGRQAYIVCPLVEGSETVVARAAEAEATRLADGPLAGVRVGLAHGQQRAADRAQTMRRFAAGEIDVLVATTVIEVGVDVPNATVMVIEDADRFGLAQLHQLRGRVGRGAEQSYCFLFESPEPTEDGRRRLQALVDTTSGFDLAEIDLEMRGEGHLLGQLQSGRSDLRHARLGRDGALLDRARADARELLAAGGEPVLEQAALERFGEIVAQLRKA